MAINLLELMQKAVNNQVVGQIAGILGVDEGSANKAVGGALPAILAGFIGKGTNEAGAAELASVLDQADGTILDNIGKILGGADGGPDRLLKMGNDLVAGLFGDRLGGLLDLLSNVSGLGKKETGSLIGTIAPIIFSVLGKQKKGLGLDASGLAKLLDGQKELLKSALPPGMAGVLGLSGFEGASTVAGAAANLKDAVVHAASDKVDEVKAAASSMAVAGAESVEKAKEAVSSAAETAVDKVDAAAKAAASSIETAGAETVEKAKAAVSAAAESAEDKFDAAKAAVSSAGAAAASKVGEAKESVAKSTASAVEKVEKTTEAAAKSGGGFLKFLLTLLILAALGFVVWKFVLPKLSGGSPGMTSTEITPANAAATVSSVISEANSIFRKIKDVPSAEAALPKIDGLASRVKGVAAIAGGLPGPVKQQIKKAVTDFAPKFTGEIERVYGIPGVKAVLEPKVDALTSMLENFG